MTNGTAGQSAQGPRVVVVGGSMGGLLAGNMLHRAGCDVTVHERIGTELAERGVGIATHPELHAALESLGLSIDEAYGVRLEERITLGADGSILARYRLPQIQASWGHLYGLLRSNFPDERYIAGANFTGFEPHGEGVLAQFADGTRHRGRSPGRRRRRALHRAAPALAGCGAQVRGLYRVARHRR